MPWWDVWQKELLYLISQQQKLCWISSAMRSKLLSLSCCCHSAVKAMVERMKKREGGEKSSDSTWSLQWGPPLGREGPGARSSFPWFPWHHPCLGSSSGRRLIPCGTASIPCICQPTVEPAPAACQGLAIWPGTDFVLEQAPSPQSCLPRETGTVCSPWSQRSKTQRLRNADSLLSGLCRPCTALKNSTVGQKRARHTMYAETATPTCIHGLMCHMTIFYQNDFLHFRFVFFQKSCDLSKKSWLF